MNTELQPDTPVQFVKGVGPVRASQLEKLGILTASDLLNYFPRKFDLLRQAQPIATITGNETNATVMGEVTEARFVPARGRPFFACSVDDGEASIDLHFFHGQYLVKQIRPGMTIAASGPVGTYRGALQMVNPQWRSVDSDENTDGDRLAPVYPAGAKLSSKVIASVIRKALPPLLPTVRERYSPEFIEQRGLMKLRPAYEAMHHPEDDDHWSAARRRMAYDECLLMQLALGILRERHKARPAFAMPVTAQIDQRIRARFPFPLTGGQDRVISEICADLAREHPMSRLVQGDVGCGKTVVALYAALNAIAHHRQVAMMAPTEILAEQHYRKISAYLSGSRVRIALLTGSMPAKKRTLILARLKSGEIDLIVGTHALLSEGVKFSQLALVIIDEQHKFGVSQRGAIRAKGFSPHYLVMTATPIPRTLSMTVFGDLDVSIIDELPPGRGQTQTRLARPKQMAEVMKFVRQQLDAGRQAYFIYPLVNPSAESDLKTAVDAFEKLKTSRILGEHRVGLIHGQLPNADKQAVMTAFTAGKIKALVASVVIEVGVDVPNASVMVIEHAERFGLAQLHQLRGRIGRGADNAFCILMGNPGNPIAARRLEVLCRSSDGFVIAEEDLRIRGPGEFFGSRQHGLPELKVADLIEDFDLLRLARRDATAILAEDPTLSAPHNQQLRHELKARYAGRMSLPGAS